MATIKLTNDNIKDTLANNKVVIIDFWAEWCGPCRGFAPVFDAASEQHADIVFAKVNVDTEPAIAQEYGIRSIPTLAVIKNGEIVKMQSGAMPGPIFEQFIQATVND